MTRTDFFSRGLCSTGVLRMTFHAGGTSTISELPFSVIVA